MNVTAIIQARMGSTRLPGKVLMDISGCPMLGRVVDRVKHAKNINDIVIATTDKTEDNVLLEFCREQIGYQDGKDHNETANSNIPHQAGIHLLQISLNVNYTKFLSI